MTQMSDEQDFKEAIYLLGDAQITIRALLHPRGGSLPVLDGINKILEKNITVLQGRYDDEE